MNREDKIKKIYEVIADKTLSFGCNVLLMWHKKRKVRDIVNCIDKWPFIKTERYDNTEFDKNEYSIIWHPVMIWDVIDYNMDMEWNYELNPEYNNWLDWDFIRDKTITLRENLRRPIEEQTDECIDFVFWLL